MSRYYKSKTHFCFVLSDERHIPIGFYVMMQEKGKQWGTTMGCMRNAPDGTGKKLLTDLLNNAKRIGIKELTAMTAYDNFKMLGCAIRCGFKIIRRDNYGYELRYTFD